MSRKHVVYAMTDGVRQQAVVTPGSTKTGVLYLSIYDDAFASIVLTPDQAREIAAHLTACAATAEGENHD